MERKKLVESGINVINNTGPTFIKEDWTTDDILFDLIIKEPRDAPSRSYVRKRTYKLCAMEEMPDEEIMYLPKLGNRVLKSGGFVLIFLPFDLFRECYEAFSSNGYSVMPFP